MLNFPDISVFFNQILGVEVFFATLNKGTMTYKVSIELPHTQGSKGSRGIFKFLKKLRETQGDSEKIRKF